MLTFETGMVEITSDVSDMIGGRNERKNMETNKRRNNC